MLWILFIALQAYLFFVGIRREEAAGLWSWSMFFFVVAFLLAEACIIALPVLALHRQNPSFWYLYAAGWLIAAVNFFWFLRVCRRWNQKQLNPLP